MKIRLGFVTNSSSSCFMISQKSLGGMLTVNGVFGILCGILNEAKDLGEQLIAEADNIGVDNFAEKYVYGDDNDYPDELFDYCSYNLGVEMYDILEAYRFVIDKPWIVNSDNYESMRSFVKSRYGEESEYPFTIVDYGTEEGKYYRPSSDDFGVKDADWGKVCELCRIGIHSSDGWIPNYILSRLREISEYCSLHI